MKYRPETILIEGNNNVSLGEFTLMGDGKYQWKPKQGLPWCYDSKSLHEIAKGLEQWNRRAPAEKEAHP